MRVNWAAAAGVGVVVALLVLVLVTSRDTGTSTKSQEEIVAELNQAKAEERAERLANSDVPDPDVSPPTAVPIEPPPVGRSPEQEAFADQVDAVCTAVVVTTPEERADRILKGTEALDPPIKRGIYENWLEDLREVAALRDESTGAPNRRLDRLIRKASDRADKIGKRYGMRACTVAD